MLFLFPSLLLATLETGLSKHEPCAFDKYVCLISPFPLLFTQPQLGPEQ